MGAFTRDSRFNVLVHMTEVALRSYFISGLKVVLDGSQLLVKLKCQSFPGTTWKKKSKGLG